MTVKVDRDFFKTASSRSSSSTSKLISNLLAASLVQQEQFLMPEIDDHNIELSQHILANYPVHFLFQAIRHFLEVVHHQNPATLPSVPTDL